MAALPRPLLLLPARRPETPSPVSSVALACVTLLAGAALLALLVRDAGEEECAQNLYGAAAQDEPPAPSRSSKVLLTDARQGHEGEVAEASAAERAAADDARLGLALEALTDAARRTRPAQIAFEDLPETLPQRVAAPAFLGCSAVFTQGPRCRRQPLPARLYATGDVLNDMLWERAVVQAQENRPEPLHLRQSLAQFRSMDTRSRKDVYGKPLRGNTPLTTSCAAAVQEKSAYVSS